ncbi:ABC transporter permease subunit [Flavihumibacter sp. R14]|nr:ABC transporter permease subunit [Flavihumibacter soli]
MYAFLISLRSEFFKTRKTLAFLSAILLPLILTILISAGFFINAEKMVPYQPMIQWMRFSSAFLGVMGFLLLPMLVIFQTYSVNNIEHKSDMWKSLFSLPLPKWSMYSSKWVYAVLLNALCLSLFAGFVLAAGQLLSLLKADLRFNEYDFSGLLLKIHLKMFLASLGILSIQFFLSLLWDDFLKPMGIGFLLTVFGIICNNLGWKYAFTIPYAHPMIALQKMMSQTTPGSTDFELLTKEVYISLAISLVTFIAGYFVISRRSVR